MKKYPFSKRQLWALTGACLYQCAIIGVLLNSHGVFMAAIRESVGLSMTVISAHNSIRSIAGAVTAAFLTALFYKKNQLAVMAGAIISIVTGYLLLIVGTTNLLWYVIPVLCCPLSSIGILAIPYMMQKWFPNHSGTTSGIAMAFSGIGGVIFNPTAAALCSRFGWEWALAILCALTLVMAGIGLFLLFGLNGTPEGEQYSHPKQTDDKKGLTLSTPLCFILLVLMILTGPISSLGNYLNLHMEELGFSLTAGATVTSFAMLGNISGKLIFGWLTDKLGACRAMILASLTVGAGCIILGTVQGPISVMYLAALLFGISYFCGTIAVSKCGLEVYGSQQNHRFSGIHVSINSMVSAALAFGTGPVFDIFGSFRPIFLGSAVVAGISCFVALILSFLVSRKNKQN